MYALDFSRAMRDGGGVNLWEEIDDGIDSQGEQTSYTDTFDRPFESGFYRVRQQ